MRALFLPPSVPIEVSMTSISLNSRSACSTRVTRSSAYSRLEPTGSVRRRLVKLSSACGIISVPTTLASGTATARLAAAMPMVAMRCASAARRSRS